MSAFLVMAEHVAGSVETGAHLTTTTTANAAEARLPRRGSAQTAAAAKLRGGAGASGVGHGGGGGAGWPAAVEAQRRNSSPLPERVGGGVGGRAGGGRGVGGGPLKAVTEEVVAAETIQLQHEQRVREHVKRDTAVDDAFGKL